MLFASALTIPTVIFGTMQAHQWEAASRESYDARLELAAFRLSSDVGAFMHEQAFSIQAAARVLGALDNWDVTIVGDVIQGVYDPTSMSGVFLADEDGRSVVFVPSDAPGKHAGVDYSDRSYFKAVQRHQRLIMTEAIMGRKVRTPIMTIAAPVFSPQGAWRGLVAGGIRQSSLDHLVRSFREKSDDDRIVILDGRKSVLLDTSRRLRVLQNVRDIPLFSGSSEQVGVTILDEAGTKIRMSQREVALPGDSWTVFVMTPMSVIDGVANLARSEVTEFAIYLVVIAFVIALLGSVLAGRALQRVRTLTVSLGDPTFRTNQRAISRWTPREIAELLTSGYKSIAQLQRAFDTNESLVKQLKSNEVRMLPLASAWDHIDNAIDFTNPEGTIMFSNPTSLALDGRDSPPDDVHDAPRSAIFSRDDLVDASFWATIHAGTTWRREYSDFSRQGTERRLSVAVSPVTDGAGHLTQFVIIRRDITDAWHQEKSAQRNERLAALGTMAATVAHEINNPLTYIRANLEDLNEQILDSTVQLPTEFREDFGQGLRDALDGAARVADIVQRMLRLARDESDAQSDCCELHSVAKNAVAVTENEVRHHGSITTTIPPHLWVPIRESSMFQLLVNLIHNAAQAHDEEASRPNHLRVEAASLSRHGEQVVRLIVADQGAGMSPEVVERIFDPFFTTKKIGHGTGLGLSVCRSIIEGGGGTIEVESARGVGTTFTIYLPLAGPDAPLESDAIDAQESMVASQELIRSAGNHCKVLVIDDEPAVGRAVQRILKDLEDLEVTVVTSSDEAHAALDTTSFELIISDVMMPEISGPRLWQIVTETRPDLRDAWIFMSGGIFDPAVAAMVTASGAVLVSKPLCADTLRGTVAAHLAARCSPAAN